MNGVVAPQASSIAFISSNHVHWGGSEELWAATAAKLAEQGHRIDVFKPVIVRSHSRIARLTELDCRMHDLNQLTWFLRRSMVRRVLPHRFFVAHQRFRLRQGLRAARPRLAIVSQGINHDGAWAADICRRMGVPYVLIAQKASELYWPDDTALPRLRRVHDAARKVFFVSRHNLRLTEEQLGMTLPNAEVVRNPFLVPWNAPPPWPSQADGLRLACVGRLDPREKGQHLLLRVMAREKWRKRPLHLTFYGAGYAAQGLRDMAAWHGLDAVTFAGFIDAASIWRDNHGLVLASLCEGLPLVLVEATLTGRVPIVTDVGGANEIVADETSGFLAAAPTEDALDEALERAWQRRHEWQAIGQIAAERSRACVPPDPEGVFADRLTRLLEEMKDADLSSRSAVAAVIVRGSVLKTPISSDGLSRTTGSA